jgi:hypothetical protein
MVVTWYWVLKFAVYVVDVAGADMDWNAPPPVLQLVKTYCEPIAPACVVLVEIV